MRETLDKQIEAEEQARIIKEDHTKYRLAVYKCPFYNYKENKCDKNNIRCYALSKITDCGIYKASIQKRVNQW